MVDLFTAAQVEHVSNISGRRTVAVTGRMTELGAVIGQDRVWLVGDSLDYAALWAPLRRSPSQATGFAGGI